MNANNNGAQEKSRSGFLEVDEAINYIHQNVHEPMTLNQLAKHVAYSPYHFNRIFKEKIGLPPLYYASSLKLQKAKELLIHTNLRIRDIGHEVGMQSLGTFTTRFTERVGVTPSFFRHSTEQTDAHFNELRKLDQWAEPPLAMSENKVVHGTVQAPVPFEGVILIGLFPKPIPEGLPIHGTLLSSLGNFHFTNVSPGTYYLLATAISWNTETTDVLLPHTTLRARIMKPIMVGLSTQAPIQHVMLRPPQIDDPPILTSLPLLMNNFLLRLKNSLP